MSWDQACTACEGTGKNSAPDFGDMPEDDLRLLRKAKQFMKSPAVAEKIAELKQEWDELKALSVEKAGDKAEVISFQEYMELREGDTVVTRAHRTAAGDPACKACKGKGKELTDEGKELLAFIKRWPPE